MQMRDTSRPDWPLVVALVAVALFFVMTFIFGVALSIAEVLKALGAIQ